MINVSSLCVCGYVHLPSKERNAPTRRAHHLISLRVKGFNPVYYQLSLTE